MSSPHRVHLVPSDSQFEHIINNVCKKNLVVVDYFATWCGPCKQIAPVYEQMSMQYPLAAFLKVDVDQLQQTAAAAGIEAMPTFVLYRDGKPIPGNGRIRGADVQSVAKGISEHYEASLSAEDLKTMGNEYLKMKNPQEAVHWYTQAIHKDDTQAALHSNRAAAYTALGYHAAALMDAEAALARDSNFVKGYVRKASVLLELNFFEEANESVEQGLAIDSDNTALKNLRDEIAKREQYREASHDAKKSAELKEKGNTSFKSKKFHDAIDSYSRAIFHNGNDHTIFSNRGTCFMQVGALDRALHDFDQCLTIAPTFAKAYLRKGQIKQEQGHLDEAESLFEKGLEKDPNNADLTKAKDKLKGL